VTELSLTQLKSVAIGSRKKESPGTPGSSKVTARGSAVTKTKATLKPGNGAMTYVIAPPNLR